MSNDQESNSADDADWGDALAEQAAAGSGGSDGAGLEGAMGEQADAANSTKSPELDELETGTGGGGPTIEDASLDVILDIPVTISMEVGAAKISIRNLLKLNQGSVVEMDRLAGEPLDVLVNGTLIAHAEVVVVNEKYGIRLTDVISAAERIKKLK